MAPAYRLLLHQLREGRVNKLAFVKPTGATWPLPLYDLALMTAADRAAHHRPEVELSLITPEEEPLGMFGASASAAVARLLDESGVTLHPSSFGVPGRPGWLEVRSGRPATFRRSHRHPAAPGRPAAARHPVRSRRVHPHRPARPAPRP